MTGHNQPQLLTELQGLTEELRLTHSIVNDLLELAIDKARSDGAPTESLMQAASRYNGDIFDIYERLDAYASKHAQEGGAQ